jgi:hypothetical protein
MSPGIFARKQVREELVRSKTLKGVMLLYGVGLCLSEDSDPDSRHPHKRGKAPFSEEGRFEVSYRRELRLQLQQRKANSFSGEESCAK